MISCGQQLSDRNIDAANQLLKDKFPDIQGLSTPLLGQTLTFPVYNCFEAAAGFPYVQMLHCPAKDHWLTIQVQFDEDVTVFDSAYSQVPFDVKKQIVSIIKSQHDKINLKYSSRPTIQTVEYMQLPLPPRCVMETIQQVQFTLPA